MNGSDPICVPCHPLCLNCTGDQPNECTECNVTHIRTKSISNECLCSAPLTDIFPVSEICIFCHYSCLTCTGLSATECLSCSLMTRMDVISNTNTCPC